jgi:hypothetical protein
MSDEGFISRWSRRKTQAKSATPKVDETPKAENAAVVSSAPVTPAEPGAPSPEPLPPVESLTPDSDFTPFMKPEVDADTKRRAVKMLFQDPRYNVMDGLDVYIDDYSKPDPLPDGWLEKMTQTTRLGEYRDPDWQKPEPDEENAQKTARENQRVSAEAAREAAQNDETEQRVAASESPPATDTPDGGSQPREVKKSPRDG